MQIRNLCILPQYKLVEVYYKLGDVTQQADSQSIPHTQSGDLHTAANYLNMFKEGAIL